jgi:hypothetical protein
VSLTDYQDSCGVCTWCCGSSTGIITVITPCTAPAIEVGAIFNIDFSFSGSTTWTPPACNVDPPICYPEIIYECGYVSGPYQGGLDLCGIHDDSTGLFIDIDFDITTGVFVFNTDYTTNFPAG